jgi:N-acetylmuramoyl-L-alanine amidase
MKSQFDPYTDHSSHDHGLDLGSSRNGEAPVGMALDDKRQHSDKVKLEWTNRDEHLLTGSYDQKNVFVLTTGGRSANNATFKLRVTNNTSEYITGNLFVQLRKVVKQLPEKDGKREEVTRVIPLKGQKKDKQWYEIGAYSIAPGRQLGDKDKDILIDVETLKKAYQEGDTQIASLTFLFQWRPLRGAIPGEPYFNQRSARFILVNPLEFKGKISLPDKELIRLDPNEESKYRKSISPILKSTDQPIKTEYKITESWTTAKEKEHETTNTDSATNEDKRTYKAELEVPDFIKKGLKLTLGASWERTVTVTTEIAETFRSKISTEFGKSIERPVPIEIPPPKKGYERNAFLYPVFERYYVEAIFFGGPSEDGYATERKSIEKFPMLRLVNWKIGWDDYPQEQKKEQKKTSAARSLGDGTSMRPSADRASISDRLPVIVIDPGHGGSQSIGGSSPNNATGPNGMLEKDLTLDLARRLRAILSPVANVALTRDGDVNLSLADRARAARDRHADLFLSIHLNGFKDLQTDGTEVWVAREANPQSRAFAQAILKHVQGVTGVKDRGVKQSDLGVILPNRHDPRTAACLLEVAFLTNPTQARRLAGESYRRRIAEAMASAVRQQISVVAGAGQSLAPAIGGYGASPAYALQKTREITFEPEIITIPKAQITKILKDSGWKQTNIIITLKDFRGEPLRGHRVFAEFKAPGVAPVAQGGDVAGGSMTWSDVWLKPEGTLRLLAASNGKPAIVPEGVTHYRLPDKGPLKLEAVQKSREVTITAATSAEAAVKVGAKGTVGVDFKIFEVGGEVSGESERKKGTSREISWKIVLPESTFDVSQVKL